MSSISTQNAELKALNSLNSELESLKKDYSELLSSLYEMRNKMELYKDLLKAPDWAVSAFFTLKSLGKVATNLFQQHKVHSHFALPSEAYKGYIINTLKREIRRGGVLYDEVLGLLYGQVNTVTAKIVDKYWDDQYRLYANYALNVMELATGSTSAAVNLGLLATEGVTMDEAIKAINDQIRFVEKQREAGMATIYSRIYKAKAKMRSLRRYTVRQGDTLSRIAKMTLGSMDRWRELYNINKLVIGTDPNVLRPGQQLLLPLH